MYSQHSQCSQFQTQAKAFHSPTEYFCSPAFREREENATGRFVPFWSCDTTAPTAVLEASHVLKNTDGEVSFFKTMNSSQASWGPVSACVLFEQLAQWVGSCRVVGRERKIVSRHPHK